MSKRARLRRKRSRDFESRRGYGAEVLKLGDSEYISIHPFADDAGLLARIGWQAEKCLKVDAYWKVYGDVVFLDISTTGYSVRAAGRYARWDNRGDGQVVLNVVVDAATITRAVFEGEMTRLVDDGVVGRALARGRKLGNSMIAI